MAAEDDDSAKASERAEALKRGRPPRAPVTIDLDATAVAPKPTVYSEDTADVPPSAETVQETPTADAGPTAMPPPDAPSPEPDKVSDPPPMALPPPPPKEYSEFLRFLVAGLAGGLVVLVAGIALQAAGLIPAPANKAATAALDQARQLGETTNALGNRVTTLETSSTKLATDDALQSLAGKVATLDKVVTALRDRMDRLAATPPAPDSSPPVKPPTDMSAVLDDLVARVDRIENAAGAATSGPTAADLADLGNRVTAVESIVQSLLGRVDGLAARPDMAAENARVARLLAIGALRQAAGRGGAFASEYGVVKGLGLEATAVATLGPLAEKGAPSRAELAAEFPAVADKILAATAVSDANSGFFDRLFSHLGGLVSVRPITPIAGKTPQAIVSRMIAAVATGDLATALAERDGLPEPGRIVSAVWADAAADRVTIDRLVDELALAAAPSSGGN